VSKEQTSTEGADASTAEAPDDAVAETTGPREAQLYLSRLEPWSVMKTSFVLSLGLAIVILVAVTLVWGVLTALGVFSSVNDAVESVAGSSSSVLNIEDLFSLGNVLMAAIGLSVLNVILTTVFATLFAFMYNLTVPFARGFEVTLREE